MDDTEEQEMATQSDDDSIGEAVSGRGQQNAHADDDDMFYIPERRPSLDLGQSPMDTTQWPFRRHGRSPVLSYMSLESEESEEAAGNMVSEDISDKTNVKLNRTDSFSSCYSLDSEDCEKRIPKVKSKHNAVSEVALDTPELIQDPNETTHPSMTVAFTFKAISDILGKLSAGEFLKFKGMLRKRYPKSFNTPLQGLDRVDLVDHLLERYSLQVSLQITKTLLEELHQKKLAEHLQTLCIRNEVRHDLCETLKRKYGEVCENMLMPEEKRPFEDVFTNLFIASTCNNGPNIEHEVMKIEKLDSNREAAICISTKDIFTPEKLESSNRKLTLMSGVAGSGKSMAIRRLIFDWIEGRSHQHVTFLFPLPFRELRQFEGAKISLVDIVEDLYPETKKLKSEDFRSDDCKIMFVFDGLDEYRAELDFENTELLCDHTDKTNLNVIVINLLRGRLFYRGIFLVTNRPEVQCSIPWDTPYEEIEVRGFSDPEKDEYFKKRFKDPQQANRVITYINSLKTIRIMCHLPLFCSLVADEWQRRFREQGTNAELPKSITYMYTKLMLSLARQHRRFRAADRSAETERNFLMQLGKLALNMLERSQFKISKTDWKGTGINEIEAVIKSGLCTHYLTTPYILFNENVLSFIHPTMQEYLAALYAFLAHVNQGKNIFEQQLKDKVKGMFKAPKSMDLFKSAVDRSLLCVDGKLDIFLRFLVGMVHKTNLELLQPYCTSTVKWPTVIKDVVAVIRKRINENQYPDRNENLYHCLEELGVREAEHF